MKNLFLLLTLLLAGCSKQAPVDSAGSESDEFSFGKVISVSTASLEVKEYDFAKDADIVTSYQITPQTEFGNFTRLADLQPGDDVVLDYIQEGDRRRATTLVKEEKGGDAKPHPGRLVIAPGFQQIGTTGDGGGIIRAVAGTMSLTIDDPAEQERFAALSRQPGPPPAPNAESVDLSGISQWLAAAVISRSGAWDILRPWMAVADCREICRLGSSSRISGVAEAGRIPARPCRLRASRAVSDFLRAV